MKKIISCLKKTVPFFKMMLKIPNFIWPPYILKKVFSP